MAGRLTTRLQTVEKRLRPSAPTGIRAVLVPVPRSEVGHAVADAARYAPRASEAQKLLSPAEMGELFKVLAVGRGVTRPLTGFAQGDRSHTL